MLLLVLLPLLRDFLSNNQPRGQRVEDEADNAQVVVSVAMAQYYKLGLLHQRRIPKVQENEEDEGAITEGEVAFITEFIFLV